MFVKAFVGTLIALVIGAAIYTFALKPKADTSPRVSVEVIDQITGTVSTVILPKPANEAETKDAAARLKAHSQRWLDLYRLAGSTPRISLSPVIADMQKELRNFQAEPMPECLDFAKKEIVWARTNQIDEFMSFMSNTQGSSAQSKFDVANSAMERAIEIERHCGIQLP